MITPEKYLPGEFNISTGIRNVRLRINPTQAATLSASLWHQTPAAKRNGESTPLAFATANKEDCWIALTDPAPRLWVGRANLPLSDEATAKELAALLSLRLRELRDLT